MARKRDKTTIIFVNKNQNSKKPIQVPSSYIHHWKKYMIGLFACFAFLLGTIFYLSYSKTSIEVAQEKLAKELLKSKKKFSAMDTSAIKKYYQSIDKKLLTINKYLKARGLKSLANNEAARGKFGYPVSRGNRGIL